MATYNPWRGIVASIMGSGTAGQAQRQALGLDWSGPEQDVQKQFAMDSFINALQGPPAFRKYMLLNRPEYFSQALSRQALNPTERTANALAETDPFRDWRMAGVDEAQRDPYRRISRFRL